MVFRPAIAFIFSLFLHTILFAQSFIPLRRAKPGIDLRIEINSNDDIKLLQKNFKKYYGVQAVKINGSVDLPQAIEVLKLMDDLSDLQLWKYNGGVSSAEVLQLEWIDNLTFYIPNGAEDRVLNLPSLAKIKKITLVFEVVPEDYTFLQHFKEVKDLRLIAPFVEAELPKALTSLATLSQLRTLGISLDKIKDLPKEITAFQQLEKLILVDNLSWITALGIDQLSEEKKNIEYVKNGKWKNILLEYRSQDPEIYPDEWIYLSTLFPNYRIAPIPNAAGDTSAVSGFADFIYLDKKKEVRFQQFQKDGNWVKECAGFQYRMKLDNKVNQALYFEPGYVLLIPANAFGNSVDSPFLGNYQLQVKIQNDPITWFGAGRGFQFDSFKKTYGLDPLATVEISAMDGNTPLQVRSGYFLKWIFKEEKDTAISMYAWNTASQKWTNAIDYDYQFDDSKLVPTDFFAFYSGKKLAQEQYCIDKTSLDTRFDLEGYYSLLEPGESKAMFEHFGGYFVKKNAPNEGGQNARILRRGKSLIGLKKEYVDRKEEPGIIRFSIYDKSNAFYPELSAWQDFPLEVSAEITPRQFSEAFIYAKTYADVRITRNGNEYYLDLKNEEGYWHIKLLTPAEKWKDQPGKAGVKQAEFEKRYAKYQQGYAAKTRQYVSWNQQLESLKIQEFKSDILMGKAALRGMGTYELRVRSTGLFTLARPTSLSDDTLELMIRFTDEGGIPLDVKRMVIAYVKPETQYTFGSKQTYPLNLAPERLRFIACEDHKGRIFVLNRDQLNALGLKNHSLVFLPMKPLERPVRNLRDLHIPLGLYLR